MSWNEEHKIFDFHSVGLDNYFHNSQTNKRYQSNLSQQSPPGSQIVSKSPSVPPHPVKLSLSNFPFRLSLSSPHFMLSLSSLHLRLSLSWQRLSGGNHWSRSLLSLHHPLVQVWIINGELLPWIAAVTAEFLRMEEEGSEEDTGQVERENVGQKIVPILKQNAWDHKTQRTDCDV